MSEYVLCGDIGGTHARLAIVHRSKDGMQIVLRERKSSKQAYEFIDLVLAFLTVAKQKGFDPSSACFAVAGIVNDNVVHMTNTHLVIDGNEIQRATGLDRVTIINDFEAVSGATTLVQDEDVHTLHKGEQELGVRLVMGAGTGLGCGFVWPCGPEYKIFPSEGGHADLPLQTPDELRLGHFLRDAYNCDRLSYEHVLSGRGITNLYGYFRTTRFKHAPRLLNPKEISRTSATNLCSHEAMKWFTLYFARTARDAALFLIPTGGLYIAGGIAAKNIHFFDQYFVSEFQSHEKYSSFLSSIPVSIITSYDVIFFGTLLASQH